jgi:pullulanase/glycogen debranching enzyme
MNMILVNVERDSVCMGDDMDAHHTYKFKLAKETALADIFSHLEKKRYLAGVAGKNHSWDAVVNGKKVAHFKGNNQAPENNTLLDDPVSKLAKDGQLKLEFIYNSATT